VSKEQQGRSGRRDTGTYLFVREGGRKSREDVPSGKARRRNAPIVPADSILVPFDPAQHSRLRYRRPQLKPAAVDPRLVFFLAPESDAAAVLRALADQVMECRDGAQRVLVTSARPGAGKTLTCLNLASAVAEQAHCTVVDLHPQRPGVSRAFGLDAEPGWQEVERARRRNQRAPVDLMLVADQLAVLPVGRAGAEVPELGTLGPLLDEVSSAADLVLLDGPSVLEGEGLGPLAGLYDAVLIVISPSDMAQGAYESAIAKLEGVPVLGAVVVDRG
jgi:Mrp family chromosome partitioning ATPase